MEALVDHRSSRRSINRLPLNILLRFHFSSKFTSEVLQGNGDSVFRILTVKSFGRARSTGQHWCHLTQRTAIWLWKDVDCDAAGTKRCLVRLRHRTSPASQPV